MSANSELQLGFKNSVQRPRFWPTEILPTLLLALTFVQVLAFAMSLPGILRRTVDLDFRTLYTAGYMVRVGQGSAIYNIETIQSSKARMAPINRPAVLNLPMDHPAYEALLFAPLSLLSYPVAFIAFTTLNLAALFLCAQQLRPGLAQLSGKRTILPTLLLLTGFFPTLKTLALGQDSIFLLLLFAVALTLLNSGNELGSGVLIGMGVFKFQIVIPIALLFLLWRRWRFVIGFAMCSAMAVILSILTVGISGAREYVSLLLGMSVHLRDTAKGLLIAMDPKAMLNLRGLFSAAFYTWLPDLWIQRLVILASLAVLLIAARCRPSLPLAIVAASLVSYHLNAQDAIILIIPISLCLCSNSTSSAVLGIAALVGPLVAFSVTYGYLYAVAMLALFVIFVLKQDSLDPRTTALTA